MQRSMQWRLLNRSDAVCVTAALMTLAGGATAEPMLNVTEVSARIDVGVGYYFPGGPPGVGDSASASAFPFSLSRQVEDTVTDTGCEPPYPLFGSAAASLTGSRSPTSGFSLNASFNCVTEYGCWGPYSEVPDAEARAAVDVRFTLNEYALMRLYLYPVESPSSVNPEVTIRNASTGALIYSYSSNFPVEDVRIDLAAGDYRLFYRDGEHTFDPGVLVAYGYSWLSFDVVPEPGPLALMALAGMGFIHRRR